jgi:hypothetical protein
MIDSTPLSIVVDQGPAGTTQLVVEADTGGQAEKALQYTFFEAREGAGSMAFQGEEVLAGVEDGLDALAEWSEMRTFSGLIPTLRTDHGSFKVLDSRGELFARIALVAQEDLPSRAPAVVKEFQTDLAFVPFGRAKRKGAGSTVCGEDGMQAHPPEVAGMAGAIPVVTDVGQGGAQSRFPASCALDRSRVDKQKIIVETRTFLGKEDHEPFQEGGKTATALEVAGLSGDTGKQMPKRPPGPREETPIRRDAHDGLRHRERNDLGIGSAPTGVSPFLWQKVVGCAINMGAEGVEVGVHRGLLVDGVLDTADFGLSASHPFRAAIFVESII